MKLFNDVVDMSYEVISYHRSSVGFIGDCFPYELMLSEMQTYYLDDLYTLAIL